MKRAALLLVVLFAVGCSPSTEGEPDTSADAGSEPAAAVAAGAAPAQGVEADQELLSRADASRFFGTPDTDVVVEEFFDFACPTCANFHGQHYEGLKEFIETEGLAFVARVYPLPRLMRGFQAAEAALCGGAIGGPDAFKGMQDRIFAGIQTWRPMLDPRATLQGYAQDVGVDMTAWQDCVDRDAMAPLILADIQVARAMGASSTPTFTFRKVDSETAGATVSGIDALAGFPDALARARGQ